MNSPETLPGLGEELVPPREAEDVDELVRIFRRIQDARDRRKQPVPRNVHPKQHGCLRANFIVQRDLPPQLCHGVFAAPRTFTTLVRFSNSKQRDDRLPDGHGMALKLLEVDGPRLMPNDLSARTQDFILIDHPVFFARDVADLVPLVRHYERLMTGGMLAKAKTVLAGMLSRDRRFKLLRQAGAKRPESPLQIQYWSTTPYRLGKSAMKFSLRPTGASLPTAFRSHHKLKEALAAHLRARDASFDFLVQLQGEPERTPIEDATVEWDDRSSPFVKVATLVIPRQEFDTPVKLRFGEDLFFTPWHGLEAHRPLGGINRARRKAYEVISDVRRQSNGAARAEPNVADVQSIFGG